MMKTKKIKLGSKVWYKNKHIGKAKGIVEAYGPDMCLVQNDGWAEEYWPCATSDLILREKNELA